MPQRYIATDPRLGANFYQSYLSTGGYPTLPSALAEIGVPAGTKVNGSSNTTWTFCNMGTASPVVTAGTAVAVNTSTFVVQTGTSTLNGTGLVGMAASVPGGVWLETSGATLTLTPLTLEEAQAAVDEAAKASKDAAAAEAKAKAELDAVKAEQGHAKAADKNAHAATSKAHA